MCVLPYVGEESNLAPTELELAAGKLFLDWLAAEKEAAAAAERLRQEQAEADVSIQLHACWPLSC